MEEGRNAFKILTGKPKRPLGRPRRRWERNIRMDLEEMGNWVDSAQDRNYCRALINAALNLRMPQAMELVRVGEGQARSCIQTAPRSSFHTRMEKDLLV